MASPSKVNEPRVSAVPTTGIPQDILRKVNAAQPNEIISDTYPYPTKLSRKKYERDKAGLQVELLKMQRWVGETGQRIVLLFEGRDAAGKGGTIKRFMEHLNPVARLWSRCRLPPTGSVGSGTSSATLSTFPPAGRSCSSTARGTTGRWSSR